ncbi:nucleoside triphosphate pyrophosphatase [Marinimicrobium sp. ABcell2]|uniref:Maf family protein n=1 Tax=Marinimicrobium sp. ABcell2 TaxID=3069751 RepID=UPI0027B6A087|nr:Maf family protein [Marinimicrobium sp. ABcell2]MDQ2075670.1 Maf family protein [Marinimicrobium sp. ABcell2]
MRPLILASSSPYRRQLLERLGLPFSSQSPDVDERPAPGEPAKALVKRLAEAKARALSEAHPGKLIIGSDQVAVLDGQILGKPGNFERARAQLLAASGRSVEFLTGLCLLNTDTGTCHVHCEPFRVHFRDLSPQQVEMYIKKEEPYDCAGSFKAEGLGIRLFQALEGRDPNALIGLPLIALIDLLQTEGVDPLNPPA